MVIWIGINLDKSIMQDLEIVGWSRVVFASGTTCGGGDICPQISFDPRVWKSELYSLVWVPGFWHNLRGSTHQLVVCYPTSPSTERGFLRFSCLFWHYGRTGFYGQGFIWVSKRSYVADLILQTRKLKPTKSVTLFIHPSASLSSQPSTFVKCLQSNRYCARCPATEMKIRFLTLRNSQLSRTEDSEFILVIILGVVYGAS